MQSLTLQSFRGLDLRNDPEEAQGAIDALNVDFDRDGRVRTRDGYTQVSAGSSDLSILSMVQQGTNFVTLEWGGEKARAYDNTGAVLASSATLADTPASLVKIGTATASYVFGGTGDALGHILRWDGSAWAYPNVGYSAYYVGVTPWDNRLMLASEISPTTNASRVRFSDPGDPGTFGANNYEDLTPGDGEQIRGIVTWRDKVFVFKDTKFFVFYGTSPNGTGGNNFDYRTVTAIGSARGSAAVGAVAMDDGVYFANDRGVFRTTGGPPEKVSAPIDPLFGLGSAAYFTSAYDAPSASVVSRFRKKLIISYAPASTDYWLVYDTEHNAWSYWNVSGWAAMEYVQTAGTAPVLLFAGTDGKIHKFTSASTTDNGTAIASRYRTGFIDGGSPEQEKWIRSMELAGTGTVNVKTAVNDAVTLSSATSVAMGTSPAVSTGRWSAGTRGRNISVDISATSGQWSLSHLSLDIGAVRATTLRAA